MCVKVTLRVNVSANPEPPTFLGSLLEALKGNFDDVSYRNSVI
jgi:hypothetical protein